MATVRNIINYLPQYMQEYVEIQKIMSAEQPEIDDLITNLDNVWKDQFLQDATENGISRLEKILGIVPKLTDTLEERRFRIYAKQNQEVPYTITKLNEVLTNLCGADGFSIASNWSTYTITIKLALSSASNYSEVEKILKKMIPANLVNTIQIMYNKHEMFEQFTHSELSAYTHYQLRNEVITQ